MKKMQMISTAAVMILLGASAVLAAPGKSSSPMPVPMASEARPEVVVIPDTRGVYVVAVADADMPQSSPIVREEKPIDQTLEKGKAAVPEERSEGIIRVWPTKPPDNVKSAPERQDENKQTPPDRF